MNKRHIAITIFISIISSFAGGFACNYLLGSNAIASQIEKTVTATHFALLDEHGNHRGGIGFDEGNPTLYFRDTKGVFRACFFLAENGPMMALRDAQGINRIVLDFNDNLGPTIGIFGSDKSPQLVVSSQNNGDSGITIFDNNKKGRMALGLSGGNPGLSFMDSNKHMPLIMQARDGQGALISLQHPGSKRPAVALGVQQGNGFLYALDAQRNGVFAGAQPGRTPALGLLQGGKPLWSALPGGQAPDLPEIERGLDLESLTKGLAH